MKRRQIWVCVETVRRDGTAGSGVTRHLYDDAVIDLEVSKSVAVILITDVATDHVLAAVALRPTHPANKSTRHKIQLEG